VRRDLSVGRVRMARQQVDVSKETRLFEKGHMYVKRDLLVSKRDVTPAFLERRAEIETVSSLLSLVSCLSCLS